MKVIVIGALPSSLYNFRGNLIKALTRFSSVTSMACGADNDEINSINSLGSDYVEYPVSRNGLNPVNDLKTFFSLINVFKRIKPNLILAYTIKPVVWGGLASRCSNGTKFYAMITGLGFAFQPGGLLKSLLMIIVKYLYKIALSNAEAVIFQNSENRDLFIEKNIVPSSKCFLVNGSGVDLSFFTMQPVPKVPRFLLIARLLGDKGIREYFAAASFVKSKYPTAEFHLLGPEDPSPDGIPIIEVLKWQAQNVIKYHGSAYDVRPFIKECSVFVLPSYHEGVPRTVLEAMAMGRPVLTTNVPGCKETVVCGVNGWLVEKASVEQLIERIIWFIENPSCWEDMGNKSRSMAVEKFDVNKVNSNILAIMGFDNEEIV